MGNVFDCDVILTMVDFSGEFNQMSGPASNGSDNIVVDFNDDMTRISGPHTWKWGYTYDNTHYNGKGEQNISGYTNFSRLNTSVPLNTNQATGAAVRSPPSCWARRIMRPSIRRASSPRSSAITPGMSRTTGVSIHASP